MIVAITSLDFIWNFNSFGLVYVLTEAGPAGKTELPMLFAYNEAFKYGEFGYAAALGNAMVLVIAVRARLLPLGPAEGDDAVIVSSHPKAARTCQYVRAGRLHALPRASRCSGCSRSSFKGPRELVELHPSFIPHDADARELPRSRSTENDLLHAALNSLKVATRRRS